MPAGAAQSAGAHLRADIRCCQRRLWVRALDQGRNAQVWREIQSGWEWIVDADVKDFFGSIDLRSAVEPAAGTDQRRLRRLAGSNNERSLAIIEQLRFQEVYVYTMGMEP